MYIIYIHIVYIHILDMHNSRRSQSSRSEEQWLRPGLDSFDAVAFYDQDVEFQGALLSRLCRILDLEHHEASYFQAPTVGCDFASRTFPNFSACGIKPTRWKTSGS